MGSVRMIFLAVLALVSVCSGQVCKVPTASISEGCVQCFSYSMKMVPGTTPVKTTRMPTFHDCEAARPEEYFFFRQTLMLDETTTFFFLCSHLKPITETTFPLETACEVGSTPVHSMCIGKDEEVFTLKTPTKPDSSDYPANTVCFWNTPSIGQSQTVYVDTLRMDVQGNPTTNCNDKLIQKAGPDGTDRVSCGMANRPVFYNRFSNKKLDPIFISDGSVEASGVELLLVYVNSPQAAVSGSSDEDVCVDTEAKPTQDTSIKPICKCKPINITEICSPKSLDENMYYQKYLTVADSLPLNGEYGFQGYKGCVGVDFFGCNGFAGNVTDLDCSNFMLGMTPAEADLFLDRGAGMWDLATQAPVAAAFCNEAESLTSPNALEHIQIQGLALQQNKDKAVACSTSSNPVLRKVATTVINNDSIPVMC